MCNKRNRTPSEHLGRGLYLYYLGLSTKNVAKALSFLHIVKRSHVAIYKGIQKYRPKRISSKRMRVSEFIVDETAIKAGSEYIWFWVAIEQKRHADSCTVHIQGKKHVCGRKAYRRLGQDSWEASGFNRR